MVVWSSYDLEIREITEFKLSLNGHSVILVDMPGFDDTEIPDAATFTVTAE